MERKSLWHSQSPRYHLRLRRLLGSRPCSRRRLALRALLVAALLWALRTLALAATMRCLPRRHHRAYLIHVTKTGGTSILDFLAAGGCDRVGFCDGDSHHPSLGSLAAASHGVPAVAVLREPTQRFLSTFAYWRAGSEAWPREPAFEAWARAAFPRGADDFVSALADPEHPQHGTARRATEVYDGVTWATHWAPQASWLDDATPGASQQLRLICYDERPGEFAKRVHAAIAPLLLADTDGGGGGGGGGGATHAPCDFTRIGRNNTTVRPATADTAAKQASAHAHEALGRSQLQHLRERYRRDYELWDEHCGPRAVAARRSIEPDGAAESQR